MSSPQPGFKSSRMALIPFSAALHREVFNSTTLELPKGPSKACRKDGWMIQSLEAVHIDETVPHPCWIRT